MDWFFSYYTARAPVYTLLPRQNILVVHHDRLEPCHDSTFPIWLQRKRHNILNTLSKEDREEDQGSEPDEPVEDQPSDVGLLFNLDSTAGPDNISQKFWTTQPLILARSRKLKSHPRTQPEAH